MFRCLLLFLLPVLFAGMVSLSPGAPRAPESGAVVSQLKLEELAGSGDWPVKVRDLLSYGLGLTQRKLTYRFGSADPDLGGMDCSGTIHNVLSHAGIRNVPRQADAFFHWVQAAGNLTEVTGTPDVSHEVFRKLKPGDLLFWTGTYETGKKNNPVSHVMIYLGKTQAGKPVMFGASDGRPYEGKRQNGVSVFDFRMPRADGKARFVGYGAIPGLDVSKVPVVPPAGK